MKKLILLVLSFMFLIGTNLFSQTLEIWNAEDWDAFAAEPNKYTEIYLMADIGSPQDPITTMVGAFVGVFDGNGHRVYVDINEDTGMYAGLFSFTWGATIKNLVVDGNVYGKNAWTGGIVGHASHTSKIYNCVNMANITAELCKFAGGFVGYADVGISICNCINLGNISCYNAGGSGVGGIIGYAMGGDIIENCINAGIVSENDYVGGIAGGLLSRYLIIRNCINVGIVESKNQAYGIGFCFP